MRKWFVVSLFILLTVLSAPSRIHGQIWGGQDAAAVDQSPPGGPPGDGAKNGRGSGSGGQESYSLG